MRKRERIRKENEKKRKEERRGKKREEEGRRGKKKLIHLLCRSWSFVAPESAT